MQPNDILTLVELNSTNKGGDYMADIELLRRKIDDSGMTVTSIAKKSGIERETLYNRINSKGDFTASEIVSLTNVLNLTKAERDKIFLT